MNIALLGAVNSVHFLKIANSLALKGHNVCLYTLKNHSAKADLSLYNPKIKIYSLRIPYTAGYSLNAAELRRLLKAEKTDVLNAHYATGYGTLGAKSGFHPYVLSVWGSDIYDFPNRSRICRKILCRNLMAADKILSTSGDMAKETRKYIDDNKPLSVTPFGVDTKKFCPSAQKKEGITVGFVKGFSRVYAPQNLIRAFAAVKNRMPDEKIRLVMYGEGEMLNECRELAKNICGDSVYFGGAVPNSEVPKILQSIDIFCVPSIRESFGVAAVEAMSCGVPCVVSAVGGLCEVVFDGVTGFCVPAGDSDALALKIITLALNKELRKKMGDAGRQRALNLYDSSRCTDIIENELKSAAENGRARG